MRQWKITDKEWKITTWMRSRTLCLIMLLICRNASLLARINMWCDLANWVGTRKYRFSDTANISVQFPLYFIVLSSTIFILFKIMRFILLDCITMGIQQHQHSVACNFNRHSFGIIWNKNVLISDKFCWEPILLSSPWLLKKTLRVRTINKY